MHTINSITPICHKLHAICRKLILATGFFDLLHDEHIAFLKKAREQGDILIVAVESDARARKLKGKGRPVQTQSTRAKNLLSLVDFVILLPDNFNTPESHRLLIQSVYPDILAVSSHTKYQEEKANLVQEFGGKLVVVHTHNPNISTTQLINNSS